MCESILKAWQQRPIEQKLQLMHTDNTLYLYSRPYVCGAMCGEVCTYWMTKKLTLIYRTVIYIQLHLHSVWFRTYMYTCVIISGAFTWKSHNNAQLASSCMSVRLSAGLGSHQTDFHEILYLSVFRKSVEKLQVPLKYGKNNGYFTWRSMPIYDHISLISS